MNVIHPAPATAINTLRAAFYDLERDAAPGVDGETWEHYGESLEANLALLESNARLAGEVAAAGATATRS